MNVIDFYLNSSVYFCDFENCSFEKKECLVIFDKECNINLKVCIKIKDGKVQKYCYMINRERIILKAVAELLGDKIIGESVEKIINLKVDDLIKLGINVSERRKRGLAVLLLAVENLILEQLGEKKYKLSDLFD